MKKSNFSLKFDSDFMKLAYWSITVYSLGVKWNWQLSNIETFIYEIMDIIAINE